MIKAVLLDLDDTLLGNPALEFTRRYLGALDGFLRERLGIEDSTRLLMAGVQAAIASTDPLRTNLDVFYATVEPQLPLDRATFDAAVEDFYREVYPGLRADTTRRPQARALAEWLIAQGYTVVVATNPFFPRVAVEQRLDWAGAPVGEVPFALVTTLENMHFTKPHPAYFEEILARVGVQADEAVMVGDDWENDIVPAWAAGLNTFWIGDDLPDLASPVRPDGSGPFDEFARRVRDENWLETLASRPLAPAQIGPRLAGNLAALMGIAGDIPPEAWAMRPHADEWTPVEVVCHLFESERDVQRPRLETILAEDNPFLSEPNPPPGPATRACPSDGRIVARGFATERQITLDLLARLEPGDWQRPARHYIFGPTTLLEMAAFTAQHDRLHFVQLCQTVVACR